MGKKDFYQNYSERRKWRNMIQYARRKLVDKGLMDNLVRDRWKVTQLGYRTLGKEHPNDYSH